MSPGRNVPDRSARANGFSTSRWIVRLSGRAPNAGSVPSRTISVRAAGVSSSARSLAAIRCLEVGEEQVHDRDQLGVGQRVEHDDLVDPVEELGPERAPRSWSVTRRFIDS